MKILAPLILGLGLLVSAPAHAQFNGCVAGLCNIKASAGLLYTGPQDAVSQAPELFYGSTYAVSNSYASGLNLAFNVRRASDGHTCDIPFVATGGAAGNTKNCSTGGDNGQTPASFLTSTTGTTPEDYEEMGTGAHVTQATSSLQPNIVLNCVGTLPCFYNPGTNHGSQGLFAAGTNLFPALTQPFTVASIFNRDPALTTDYEGSFKIGAGIPSNNNFTSITSDQTLNIVQYAHFYIGDNIPVVATDGFYHAFLSTANGASTFNLVDGRNAVGNFDATTIDNGAISIGSWPGNATFKGNIPEEMIWANPGLSLAQGKLLCINQQNRYILQKACTQPTGTYVGLGDAVSSGIAATAGVYISCGQAYNGGYADGAHVGCNLRLLSNSHTCDFLLTTAGAMGNSINCSTSGDNGKTLATLESTYSTTAVVTEAYDQTLNGSNAPQATTGAQPALTLNCLPNSLPCIQTDGSSTFIVVPVGGTPLTAQTLVMAGRSDTAPGGFATFYSRYTGNGPWLTAASPTTWNGQYFGGSTNITLPATVASVHASVFSMAAPSTTFFNVDGTETTATVDTYGGPTPAAGLGLGADPGGGFAFAVKIGEFGGWTNGFGTADRAAAAHSECTRFGTTIPC